MFFFGSVFTKCQMYDVRVELNSLFNQMWIQEIMKCPTNDAILSCIFSGRTEHSVCTNLTNSLLINPFSARGLARPPLFTGRIRCPRPLIYTNVINTPHTQPLALNSLMASASLSDKCAHKNTRLS